MKDCERLNRKRGKYWEIKLRNEQKIIFLQVLPILGQARTLPNVQRNLVATWGISNFPRTAAANFRRAVAWSCSWYLSSPSSKSFFPGCLAFLVVWLWLLCDCYSVNKILSAWYCLCVSLILYIDMYCIWYNQRTRLRVVRVVSSWSLLLKVRLR